MVSLCALFLAVGCKGDPTEPLRASGVDKLIASPSAIFMQLGETKSVDVGAVDAQGNALDFEYLVTSQGSGISVKRDSSFRGVFLSDSTFAVPPTDRQFRFTVTATGYGASSFTVSAGGKDVVVPVQVVAQNVIAATFSNTTPALAEVVTLTAPAGVTFAQTSTVTFGTDAAFVQSVAADGSSIDFIPPPNLANVQATITDVSSAATPGFTYTPTTADRITTASVPTFPGTFSNTTPAVNEPVTLTLNGATFDPAATLILGSSAPTVLSSTPTTLTFLPTPGTTALLVVNGVVLDVLPQFSLTLPSADTDSIKVDATVPTLAGSDAEGTAPTVSTPNVGETSSIYDAPDYAASVDHFYKLVVGTAGDYTITYNWTVGSDIDLFVCPAPIAPGFANCDFTAATGNQPESATYSLTPGTYIIVGDDFGGDAAGTTVQITVTRES
jgi:hypothetical protein